ncbi:toxin-antitoxin system YwqK family antitoxin [Chryseobacterium daecheongense]|uniref:Antitoxin component YwqK of YwqJK toxin-antitoxin module n=1 Tax=Chryseobacterium daecheongense TaxID=192389 RepID=A0A3N0VWX3_9FLAO|nr:toxin-antitoxin system YwqK family antitoxin [Chryseobacterium daecheongense]ROH96388.1 toxin-antitoxin system YwqK family antitoxin [Chryseobacterium daecheongense]TDX91592.1 antitoxin component YwqK of YwqJK toxin-antitoxin module [Chryseobacterium daecheongense]
MKYIISLLFCVSSFFSAQKPCGYKDGLQEGTCKQFYKNGQVKEIAEWKKGKLEGDAVFYFENGKIQAQGEYKKGYKVKEWSYFDKDGKLTAKETFRNGEKNIYDNSSTATFFSSTGVVTEISNYKFGKLHGESKLFHEDGKSVKQIGYYEGGAAIGKWKTLYPSGKIQRETEFVNDKWNGNRIHYREDGSVEKTEVYKDGKLISTK